MADSMGTHASRAAGAQDIAAALEALRAIVRALHVNSHAVERSTGLGGAQLFVLQQLAEARAASMNELAERTHTHQSTVSVVVRRLAERGLVSRAASDVDARRIEIALSARGRALLRRAPATVQAQLLEALHRLPAAKRRGLAEGMQAWVRAAHLHAARPPLFFEKAPARAAGKRRLRARV